MKFKTGVILDIDRSMARVLPLIDLAHSDIKLARDSFVTSANDGAHMKGSLHYAGKALDLRTRDLTKEQIADLVVALRKRLNGSIVNKPYQVIVESDHIHLEYDVNA